MAQTPNGIAPSPHVIGTVKGPGDSSNQYVFITADNPHVKVGEFVYYEASPPEDSRTTLQFFSILGAAETPSAAAPANH